MKTRNPILGLLTFSFHELGGRLIRALPLPLLIGFAAQIPGLETLLLFFPFIAVSAAPYVVMMRSEGTPTWDRYQIAMPVKRKDIATILYLNVFIASLLGIPLIGIVWAVGYVLNGATLAMLFNGSIALGAWVYSAMFFSTALLYPLGLSRLGQRNTQSVFFGSLILGVAIAYGIFAAGNAIGLSDIALSLVILSVSGTAYIISLLITKAMFATMDF